MKQTSLFQSWTRTLPTSPASNLVLLSPGQSTPNYLTPICSPKSSSTDSPFDLKPNLDDEDDDLILANLLDNFNDTHQLTNPNLTDSKSTKFEDPSTLLAKLSKRPQVTYRPTGNDSDHLEGFDESQGPTWIYPTTTTNGAFREYQFNIIEQCLFKNTLVCLPTGLGKTFIAAVVMYNFLRWYPTGKLIFMAPTRPLVTQQMAACSKFLGLSTAHDELLFELTGSIPQSKRKSIWSRSHMFFLTPQVLVNDLQAQICPGTAIRILVFDEAHKATGNHAYCQVLRLLTNPPYNHRQFRILALSATPASDVEGVQLLIANLLISHLELRTDTSADVKPYIQDRQIETIIVPLGPELCRFHAQLVECIRMPLERLRERGVLGPSYGDLRPDRIAKFTIIKAREEWSHQGFQTVTPMEANLIQSDFGLVICLLHALELLVQHGLRPLYQYLDGVYSGHRASASVRNELVKFTKVERLFADLSARFSTEQTNSTALFSTQAPFQAGHPKLDKLKSILADHFRKHASDDSGEHTTRVIVFTQFRDSVDEIMHMLKQMRPLIRPASFIGQSSKSSGSYLIKDSPSPTTPRPLASTGGISQRDQIRVMDSFRNGTFNTLVSTCVGEEGIDVGQVDLIVCFDAFKSPVRLMQRLGRTGRRRLGRIIILLTEGREQRNLAVSMARTTSIHKALLDGGAYRKLAFYPHNPRMVPLTFEPKLKFEDLSAKPNLKFEPKAADRETSSGSKKQKKQESDASLKSHIDAIGLNYLSLRLGPVGPAPLMSLSSQDDPIKQREILPQITQLYGLSSSKCLTAMRRGLQASAHIGSSSSCQHLVSILRLVELHRRDLTTLTYHALGLRSVDAEVRLCEVLDPLSQALDSPNKRAPPEPHSHKSLKQGEEQQSKSDESTIFDAEKTKSICISSDSNPLGYLPSIIRGTVSETLLFDPRLCSFDKSNVQLVESFLECYTEGLSVEPVTANSLKRAWGKLLDQIKLPVEQHDKVPKPPSPEIDLKLNIENSLLEVINTEPFSFVNEGNCRSVPKADSDRISVTSICNDSKPNLTHAFNIPSLRIARSTPYKKPYRTNPSVYSTSQVNLDEALAMLEQSTVQLDASGLLSSQDDGGGEPTIMNISHPTIHSTVFNGPLCPSISNNTSADMFLFGTKLSFGQELEDFLLPSQIPHEDVKNRSASPTLSGGGYGSPFSSQVNWSPISVEGHEQEPSPTPALFTSSPLCSPNLGGTVSRGPKGDPTTDPFVSHSHLTSPMDTSGRDALTHLHTTVSNRSCDVEKNDLPRKSKKATNGFFLSQAHCSELDSTELGEDQNQYDSSFIDDQGDDGDTTDSSPNIDAPDMTAVYLQTIRSPSLPLGNQRPKLIPRRSLGYMINKKTAEAQWKSRVPSWNPPKKLVSHAQQSESSRFVFSQMPEQDDDYELDSFCVEDEPDPAQKPTRYVASKRRRRLKINLSDSEEH